MAKISISEFTFSIFCALKTRIGNQWKGRDHISDPFNRLYYPCKGNAAIEKNGKTFTLSEGNIYLIPAQQSFKHIPSPDTYLYVIHFECKNNIGTSIFDVFDNNWEIPPDMLRQSQKFFERLGAIIKEDSPAANLEKQALMRYLLVPFISGLKHLPNKEDMVKYERFHNALLMIEEQLAKPLTVEMLAESAHLHPNYFSNLFSEQFGVSPLQYIIQKRIERAQVLLYSSSKPVNAIAAQTGYDDPCYFNRIFKKYTGMTPLQYRKNKEIE